MLNRLYVNLRGRRGRDSPGYSTQGWSMQVWFDARRESLRAARKAAAAVAVANGADEEAVFELEVALGEALSNAYIHGYGEQPHGAIWMHFLCDQRGLTIRVVDYGNGSRRPLRIPTRVPVTGERGRGLYLMSRLMDHVTLAPAGRDGTGTEVMMSKRLN